MEEEEEKKKDKNWQEIEKEIRKWMQNELNNVYSIANHEFVTFNNHKNVK